MTFSHENVSFGKNTRKKNTQKTKRISNKFYIYDHNYPKIVIKALSAMLVITLNTLKIFLDLPPALVPSK